jgi:hypothetical protein
VKRSALLCILPFLVSIVSASEPKCHAINIDSLNSKNSMESPVPAASPLVVSWSRGQADVQIYLNSALVYERKAVPPGHTIISGMQLDNGNALPQGKAFEFKIWQGNPRSVWLRFPQSSGKSAARNVVAAAGDSVCMDNPSRTTAETAKRKRMPLFVYWTTGKGVFQVYRDNSMVHEEKNVANAAISAGMKPNLAAEGASAFTGGQVVELKLWTGGPTPKSIWVKLAQ